MYDSYLDAQWEAHCRAQEEQYHQWMDEVNQIDHELNGDELAMSAYLFITNVLLSLNMVEIKDEPTTLHTYGSYILSNRRKDGSEQLQS